MRIYRPIPTRLPPSASELVTTKEKVCPSHETRFEDRPHHKCLLGGKYHGNSKSHHTAHGFLPTRVPTSHREISHPRLRERSTGQRGQIWKPNRHRPRQASPSNGFLLYA
ncbi:hypothetical protein BDM02DRAFT_1742307 [Thelephora ganbajun]|uniref:Uncharacterized protein n=1 Tax=Thelephora ganbajun TaxID=370292 RepID=A0ACB6ZL18_THEGA|nr:hypothetical protein BDM02DRAFT_1742307 [Thelephora ganbajun]